MVCCMPLASHLHLAQCCGEAVSMTLAKGAGTVTGYALCFDMKFAKLEPSAKHLVRFEA